MPPLERIPFKSGLSHVRKIRLAVLFAASFETPAYSGLLKMRTFSTAKPENLMVRARCLEP
jgi:hypothetical protein